MSYKCRICGINEVDNQGDICELCALGQDPYVQSQTVSQDYQQASQPYKNTNRSNVSYVPQRGANRKVLLNGGTSLVNRDPYGNDMTTTTEAQHLFRFTQLDKCHRHHITVLMLLIQLQLLCHQAISRLPQVLRRIYL